MFNCDFSKYYFKCVKDISVLLLSLCASRSHWYTTVSVCEWFWRTASCVEHKRVHEQFVDPGKSELQLKKSSSGTITQ